MPAQSNGTDDYAIIDLGSNSFHLLVAQVRKSTLRYLDRIKVVVRLAEGLQPDGTISDEKREEVFDALRHFGQRLEGFPQNHVRAIGTSALRDARKNRGFLQEAERLLGFPIDVISGREEARLIYQGVAVWHQADEQKRLVLDIGGSSTELIYGQGRTPKIVESLQVGNIRLTKKLFAGKALTRKLFEAAVAEVERMIEASGLTGPGINWEMAYGASGTMRMLEGLLSDMGLAAHGITKSGLKNLIGQVLKSSKKRQLVLEYVSRDRVDTFPAALAILWALFKTFDISRMQIAQAGVREGLMYELTRVDLVEDRRHQTIRELMDYYGVDKDQAQRVFDFCEYYYPRITESLECSPEQGELLLHWASQMHEAGMALAYRGYHKHSHYILKNSQMPGFTKHEQGQLSTLVLNHRKKIKTEMVVPGDEVEPGLVILFRLAHLFNRDRTRDSSQYPVKSMRWDGSIFTIELSEEWLEQHPLTREDLEREVGYWEDVSVSFRFESE